MHCEDNRDVQITLVRVRLRFDIRTSLYNYAYRKGGFLRWLVKCICSAPWTGLHEPRKIPKIPGDRPKTMRGKSRCFPRRDHRRNEEFANQDSRLFVFSWLRLDLAFASPRSHNSGGNRFQSNNCSKDKRFLYLERNCWNFPTCSSAGYNFQMIF